MFRRVLASQNANKLNTEVADGNAPRQFRKRRRQNKFLVSSRRVLLLSAFLLLSIFFLRKRFSLKPKGFLLATSSSISLTPLSPIDFEQYTIRINTWKRVETLKISLEHHLSCPNVAEIQIVWCTDQGPPPKWLLSMEDVVVEQHEVNSLNERFHILQPAPTKGILSLDDDILRPCIAYDWAFAKWTQHPSRIVGFDARSHEIVTNGGDQWKYAYMSTTEKANKYSLTLTRCCFVHSDYLHWYTENPFLEPIRNMVVAFKNCEDIALSLLVSSQTGGQPPLLADLWAVKSMIKLDNHQGKISAGKQHKILRDTCVDTFAKQLGLKDKLKLTKLKHSSFFEYGEPSSWEPPANLSNISHLIERWKSDAKVLSADLLELRSETAIAAFEAGLVEGSDPWRRRFHQLSPTEN